MHNQLELLRQFDSWSAFGFFFVVNILIFAASVAACWGLGRWYRRRRIFDDWATLTPLEGWAAAGSILFNALISVIGWKLWMMGFIVLTSKSFLGVLIDLIGMVMAMDLGMYISHRVAHIPLIYRVLHGFHHRHQATHPTSLFVLHPLEVLGFGSMMIMFLMAYPMDPWALHGYLALNILYGTIGHCGVEPFPSILRKIPLLRLTGTSTFHAGHHAKPDFNFGFYSLVWDVLFKTLDPQYWERYRSESRN